MNDKRQMIPAVGLLATCAANVPAGAVLTFVIDGTDVATAKADARGRAEFEIDVRMPGTAASRSREAAP